MNAQSTCLLNPRLCDETRKHAARLRSAGDRTVRITTLGRELINTPADGLPESALEPYAAILGASDTAGMAKCGHMILGLAQPCRSEYLWR